MLTEALIIGWRLFRADAGRWVKPEGVVAPEDVSLATVARLLFHHPALRAIAWFRLGSALWTGGVRGVPNWTERRIRRLYGLEIQIGMPVGAGFYVAHPVGCVLVAERIGDNVTVIAQVTLGARGRARWPTLCDRVYIGAGARVLGSVTVGSDAKVGANAVVLDDVEPDSTVVGIPARPIPRRRVT